MDGELIRDDAHHASVKYLILLQYLLLDSSFMEAAWGGAATLLPPTFGRCIRTAWGF